MKLRSDLKDYQIAQSMWGTNTKEQCRIVKSLRKSVESEKICDDWYELRTQQHISEDIVGWLVPLESLENDCGIPGVEN
jgi:hypothetical protein